ncbi:hypothetical protein C8R43DRAFT_958078 [Mycena crocata]|nr:hypothetical protein C8R43DRAFT_958078 [Mycena crocata]
MQKSGLAVRFQNLTAIPTKRRHKDKLREAGRLRMQKARANIKASGPAAVRAYRQQLCKTAAQYRERNRDTIRAADALKRAKKYIDKEGLKAFDEKTQHRSMSKTQHRHEGRLPPPHPATLPKKPPPYISPSPSPHDSDEDDADEDEEEHNPNLLVPPSSHRHRRALPERVILERVIPERVLPQWATANLPLGESLPPCACGEDGCCGCACICPASKKWILHGGHYKTHKFISKPLSTLSNPFVLDDAGKIAPRPGDNENLVSKPGSTLQSPFLVDENGKFVKTLDTPKVSAEALFVEHWLRLPAQGGPPMCGSRKG